MTLRLIAHLTRDPRHGQIAAVGVLVLAGVIWFGFEMPWWRPAAALGAALAAQWIACRTIRLPFDWRSPAITALSLTLLLRTVGWELAALAAAAAIGSKFLLRVGGRHIWNPAALAIVAVTGLIPGAWVSTGQWGAGGWIAVFAAGAGLAVTRRAGRAGVPFLFLAAWAALSFARAWWLGDPLAVPLHQLGSGALLVFAFFMISDPMTQPWHMGARAAWVAAVAALGFALQHAWVVTAGPLWGLVLMAPLVPVLDRLFPAPRKTWADTSLPGPLPEPKGATA
jgi:Na+-transporting NADH:ubiquinone oxidoreductase subunit NqrB